MFVFADIPSLALGGVRNYVARLRAQQVEHGLVPFATCGKLRKRPAVQICPSAPKEKTTLDWVVFSFSAARSQLKLLGYISISLGFRLTRLHLLWLMVRFARMYLAKRQLLIGLSFLFPLGDSLCSATVA